jgi:hypothetical protein
MMIYVVNRDTNLKTEKPLKAKTNRYTWLVSQLKAVGRNHVGLVHKLAPKIELSRIDFTDRLQDPLAPM